MLRALAAVQLVLEIDEDGFARLDVTHHLKAQGIECHRLGGDKIFRSLRRFVAAIDERADTMRIAEGKQAIACNQRHHGVSTATAAMHAGHRLENAIHIELVTMCRHLQFMRQHIEQHFRVGIGVDMPAVHAEHLFLQLLGVGQVAVVPKHDAKRRIDIKRLCLGKIEGRTRGRVADMADATITGQCPHITGTKNVAHQPGALVQVEGIAFGRSDACRVLPPVLQHHQTVIEQLVDRRGCQYTENPAHDVFLS